MSDPIRIKTLPSLALFIKKYGWYVVLAGILIVGAVLRLRGYDSGLPYLARQHEPNKVLTALWWRGELKVFQSTNYPPLYIWLVMGVQEIMDVFQPRSISDYVRVLRLIAVAMDLTTTLLLALTARRLGGRLAGALAGAVWAVSPIAIYEGVIAASDPMAFMLVCLAFYLAAVALFDPRRAWWAFISVIVGWLAILAKYPVLTAVVPGGMASLYIWWKQDRRLGLRILTAQFMVSVLILIWMIAGLGVIAHLDEGNREGVMVQEEGLARLFNVDIIRHNLSFVFYPFARAEWPYAGWGVLFAGGIISAWLLYKKALTSRHAAAWGALLFLVLTIPWLTATFRYTTVYSIRDVLPATAAAIVLWSVSIALITQVITVQARRVEAVQRYAGWAVKGAVVVLLFFLFFRPQISQAWKESTERTYPDVRVELARWAEATLDPGRILVSAENHKTFNPYWGGYEGQKWFDWDREAIADQPIAAWRDQGVSYAAIPYEQWQDMQKTDSGRAIIDDMLLLRTFPPAAHQQGPAVAFFRLWKPQHELAVDYGGEIRLVGYDLSPETLTPGTQVEMRFYWQQLQHPSTNYSVFMHFTPADDPVATIAQIDWIPVSEQRLPLTWEVTGEILISQPFYLDIPADLEPGTYVLRIGLYDFVTGQRLLIHETEDHYVLWSLTIDN